MRRVTILLTSASRYAHVPPGALVSKALAWGQHDGVVVDMDNPGIWRKTPRNLMRVIRGRNAGADVEKLPDPLVPGQEAL
jgi:hypothetical protein